MAALVLGLSGCDKVSSPDDDPTGQNATAPNALQQHNSDMAAAVDDAHGGLDAIENCILFMRGSNAGSETDCPKGSGQIDIAQKIKDQDDKIAQQDAQITALKECIRQISGGGGTSCSL